MLGTERHESRRIDNQLRGRAARQGDPGETQFFVSTEDDLMRIFAGDRLKTMMTRLKVPEDMPIEQKMITRMLESAQKKVEGHHFDTRKHVLQYDDVLNRHRSVTYKKRRQILELTAGRKYEDYIEELDHKEIDEKNFYTLEKYDSLKEVILDYIEQEVEFVVSYHTNPEERNLSVDEDKKEDSGWNLKEIYETMKTVFPFSSEEREKLLHMEPGQDGKLDEAKAREEIIQFLLEKARVEYKNIEDKIISTPDTEEEGGKMVREIEKSILLRSMDSLWVDHLVDIDYLRTGIGLRGYGQRDPLVEYKRETYHMFNRLLSSIQKEVVYSFFKVGVGLQLAPTVMASDKMTLQGANKTASQQGAHIEKKARDDEGKKVGRNDPCPCGSGKKYKKCCGS